ncbi:MAG: UDP-N-acetylglucosamine 1-carboxyvinyltransferase, partial [Planctomycetota bacterium]
FRTARVSLPGGCNIGHRPIDLHLKGLAALGTEIRLDGGYVICRARSLRGAEIDLQGSHGPTVTGTCNVMVAATRARGKTVIRNAAREPEVQDLAKFLVVAGARIEGIGTSTLEIDGVEELLPVRHSIITDRIEAATFAIAAAITQGDIMIENAPVEQMAAVITALRQVGVEIESRDADTLSVRVEHPLKPARLTALPYPGLPTDVQAQMIALLSIVPGGSRVTDLVFPERFMHVSELVRMGAQITLVGNSVEIRGVAKLSGAPVMASDLRASAALVLAALAAEGRSEVRRVYHLDRGYRAFEKKLNQLGADIERINENRPEQRPPAPHFETDRPSFLTPPMDDLDSRR